MKNKKRIVLIIVFIALMLLSVAGITLFTNLLFEGKYNLLKTEPVKKEKPGKKVTDTGDYVFACIDDSSKNSINMKVNILLEKPEKDLDGCKKYPITCEDIKGNSISCDEAEITINGTNPQEYSYDYFPAYFTYKIDSKDYIKSFKTNKFIINPSEYDKFSFVKIETINRYIQVYKGEKTKIYDLYGNKYIDYLDNYELLDACKGYTKFFYTVKDKNGGYKILDSSGNRFLGDVKMDAVLSIGYYVLIKSGNSVKLYDEMGTTLYDFGSINDIESVMVENMARIEGTRPPISEETAKYIDTLIYSSQLKNGKFVFLKYNTTTKQGAVEYSK